MDKAAYSGKVLFSEEFLIHTLDDLKFDDMLVEFEGKRVRITIEELDDTQQAEIDRLRAELHRVSESRRGQRERADDLSRQLEETQAALAQAVANRLAV